jgi:hypothetical protein
MGTFLLSVGALIGGMFLGVLTFSRVGHWILGMQAAFKGTGGSQPATRVSAMVLASGPWLLLALALIAYYVRARPWAVWSFWGFGLSVGYFAALSVYLSRKARRHAA